MKRVNGALMLVALAGTSACSILRSGGSEAEFGPLRDVRVDVENRNWSEVVVYAEGGAQPLRLGSVTTMGQGQFILPAGIVRSGRSIRLMASPIGSNSTYATAPVYVAPGQRIEFRIQNDLGISSISVSSR